MKTHTKTILTALGICLGIVAGEVSYLASELAIFALGLVVAQSFLYFWERKRKPVSDISNVTHRFSFSLLTILFSLGLFVGILRVELVTEKSNFVCEKTCTFSAKIISSPESKNDYQVFKVEPLLTEGEVLDVQVRSPLYPKYEIGETLKITGKVIIPSIISPHGETKNNNDGFDYASYLLTKNVGSEITYPHLEVIDVEAHTLSERLGRWKENLVTRTDTYVASPASQLASGMLFGSTSVSKDLTQTFRTAGLSHIIVLSGFNIAVVIATILFVLAFLPLILRISLASIFVILFVMMVGGEASVIRATLMSFIGLMATLIGRAYVAKQALILSLLVIVLYEPYTLMHDVSLHLSFLATAGIVYGSEPLGNIFKNYFSRLTSKSLQELGVTTLSAYLATLPYVLYTFGTVSVYALVANILVLPLVPLAMLISFLVVSSSYLSETLSLLLGFVDTLLINFMIGVAQGIEFLPFSSFTLNISLGFMMVLYAFIFLLIKFVFIKINNETRVTRENGNLVDVIAY